MMTYCNPWNAGLASETSAVTRRLRRLIRALDDEINSNIVQGGIVDDVRAFRQTLVDRLRADGWTVAYDIPKPGSLVCDRLRVRAPKGR